MRIISGQYGKRRFSVPTNFKSRPTTDMAKEGLFNVLQHHIEWDEVDALDLFAGTGSIGFEMLSRGARSVLAIEKEYQHYAFIKKVAAELSDDRYRVYRSDVFKFINDAKEQADKTHYQVIFADPPFHLKKLEEIPEKVLDSGLLAKGGYFIFEHPRDTPAFDDHPLFLEERVYGSVHFTIFREKDS